MCVCVFACSFRMLYQAVPLYVAEISPEKLRGRMQVPNTAYAAIGVLVSGERKKERKNAEITMVFYALRQEQC